MNGESKDIYPKIGEVSLILCCILGSEEDLAFHLQLPLVCDFANESPFYLHPHTTPYANLVTVLGI